MKNIIGFLVGIISIFTLSGCNAKAQHSDKSGIFADVISFNSYDEMHNFMSDKGLDDVYACNDGVGDMKLILVNPASYEIKLELYHAVTDKYGNVEPNYEFPLCGSEVGQPIYFATTPDNGKTSVVVVAVDGIGHRAYWNPEFDENGKLNVNEDFGSFNSKNVNKADGQNSVKTVDYGEYGLKFMVKDAKVFMEIYDVDKCIKNISWNNMYPSLNNGTYPVENIDGDCKDIFIGDIGQDTNPILCIMLYDNTVEVLSVRESVRNMFLMSSGRLKGLWDIESFVNAGGGEYEYEGEKMYSYITIYGIDSGKRRTEIELFYGLMSDPYVAPDGQKLLLLSDYTLIYKDKNYEYRGTFRYETVREDKSIYDITYNFIKSRELNADENAWSGSEMKGTFRIDMSEYGRSVVTPLTGFDFGVGYDNQIIFSNSVQ